MPLELTPVSRRADEGGMQMCQLMNRLHYIELSEKVMVLITSLVSSTNDTHSQTCIQAAVLNGV
jgi:hypothetical protein